MFFVERRQFADTRFASADLLLPTGLAITRPRVLGFLRDEAAAEAYPSVGPRGGRGGRHVARRDGRGLAATGVPGRVALFEDQGTGLLRGPLGPVDKA